MRVESHGRPIVLANIAMQSWPEVRFAITTFSDFWSTMDVMELSAAVPRNRRATNPETELGPASTLDLPTDRPRRPERSGARGCASLTVALDLPAGDRAPVLVAAFAGLLHRYTNEETVPLGFVATDGSARLVRIDFADTPSFEAVVAQARAAIDAPASGALPQVVLALDADPPNDVAEQDLWLAVDGAEVTLDYDADLYEPGTADRLLGHVDTLLRAAVREPGALVAELPLLAERERALVLEEWNDTSMSYPDECVDVLFSEQAQRTPDAIAVVCGDEQLDLRRTRSALFGARTLPAPPRRRAGRARRDRRRPLRRAARRRCSASSRPAARTCRSIPRIPSSGRRSCSRTQPSASS